MNIYRQTYSSYQVNQFTDNSRDPSRVESVLPDTSEGIGDLVDGCGVAINNLYHVFSVARLFALSSSST